MTRILETQSPPCIKTSIFNNTGRVKIAFACSKGSLFENFSVSSPRLDGEGGRRSAHLYKLVSFARNYTHNFVIVGDNDVKNTSVGKILHNFLDFERSVWPSRVKFAGNMRRKDLCADTVSSNNVFLSSHLGYKFKKTKMIKRADFDDDCEYHFDKNGEGF